MPIYKTATSPTSTSCSYILHRRASSRIRSRALQVHSYIILATMKPNFQAFAALLVFSSPTWAVPFQSWLAGAFDLTAPAPFCFLDNGVNMHLNSDGNLVIFKNADPASLVWDTAATVPDCNGQCRMVFQSDGNLVIYYGNQPLFNSNTAGRGWKFTCIDAAPYLFILDGSGNFIWYPKIA